MDPTPRFLKAYSYVSINEGTTYVNNPVDRGGPTKYGITLQSLTAYWKVLGKSTAPQASNVAALTVADARAFYFSQIWPQVQGDVWTCDGVATALFDAATLIGAPQTVKYAQANTHQTGIVIDGILGTKTVAAIKACDPVDVICALSASVGRHCVNLAIRLPAQQAFMSTWGLRAGRMLTLALDTQRTAS